jgi:pimeloyl-ACP methyl ester carboxylesterase
MRGEFVDLGGHRLYCYAAGTRGAGAPVVLVHGAFTSSHLWRETVPRLPKGHRVLVLDLLGHGRSDLPPDAAYDTAAHADRVIALLAALGVEPACLVGHGVGAAIVADVAHRAPARVAGLVLANPCLLAGPDTGATAAPRALRRLAALVPLWRALPPAWLASTLHTRLLRGYANRTFGSHALDVYLKPYRSETGRAVACRQLRALASPTACIRLADRAIAVPTAVLLGANDPFVARRGDPLRATLPGSVAGPVAIEPVADIGHAIPEEAPERLAAAVADLLTLPPA